MSYGPNTLSSSGGQSNGPLYMSMTKTPDTWITLHGRESSEVMIKLRVS